MSENAMDRSDPSEEYGWRSPPRVYEDSRSPAFSPGPFIYRSDPRLYRPTSPANPNDYPLSSPDYSPPPTYGKESVSGAHQQPTVEDVGGEYRPTSPNYGNGGNTMHSRVYDSVSPVEQVDKPIPDRYTYRPTSGYASRGLFGSISPSLGYSDLRGDLGSTASRHSSVTPSEDRMSYVYTSTHGDNSNSAEDYDRMSYTPKSGSSVLSSIEDGGSDVTTTPHRRSDRLRASANQQGRVKSNQAYAESLPSSSNHSAISESSGETGSISQAKDETEQTQSPAIITAHRSVKFKNDTPTTQDLTFSFSDIGKLKQNITTAILGMPMDDQGVAVALNSDGSSKHGIVISMMPKQDTTRRASIVKDKYEALQRYMEPLLDGMCLGIGWSIGMLLVLSALLLLYTKARFS